MKLALHIGMWGPAPTDRYVELAQRAEALGFDMVATSENYGSDVFTLLTVIAQQTKTIGLSTCVMPIQSRTPASAAMTAITLDHISNGRMSLGVGVSSPGIIEGWHGQPFTRPVQRTREWLDIFEMVVAREEPLAYDGEIYQLPYRGDDGMGLGKSFKTITHPLRNKIPVYLGALGPRNIQLAVERFDGWQPVWIPPTMYDELWGKELKAAPPGFEIIATAPFSIADNLEEALLPVRRNIAMVLGGYGSREVNFNRDMAARAGFGDTVEMLQDLYLSGRQQQAADAVPLELADEMAIIGSKEHIRERLKAWKASPVTTLLMQLGEDFDTTVAHMEFLASEVL